MSKTLKEKSVALGSDKLADFLATEAESDAPLKKRLRLLLEAASPDQLAKALKTQIKVMSRSNRFIDWHASSVFARELSALLAPIEAHLLSQAPDRAIEVLDAFLILGNRVMNRCDDSNGRIGDAFRYAVKLWGNAWANLTDFEGTALAERIWHYLSHNAFGFVDAMIQQCATALRRKGLEELDKLVRCHLKKDKTAFHVFHALRDIAWLRQSPEALEEVFALTHHKKTVTDQLDMARLLIQACRSQEAIELLESIDDTHYYGQPALDLLIEAYDLESNTEKTQALRWRGFVTRKNLDYYHAYCKPLPSEGAKKQALQDAIELARNDHDILMTLHLLNALGFPDQAANSLRQRYHELEGRHYPELKILAKHLISHGYPLEAILIYRRLAEAILARAQSKYYAYAVSYLKKSKELSLQVKDWHGYPETWDYFTALEQAHAKKTAFLHQFNSIKT